jgi:protease II
MDERFFVHVGKSASKLFMYVVAAGNNMAEWRFMEASDPGSQLTLIQPRRRILNTTWLTSVTVF